MLRALWSRVYGAALIAIGAFCAWATVYQWMHRAEPDSIFILIFNSVMLCFIAFGAAAIGIERIRGREAKRVRPFVKPNEWLVENYGPAGKRILPGSEKQQ